ncbi:hypothetical protein AB0M54_43850 [Actinoplanes sp. NPDC051470]|uniref:hypothetical protein n=1 Tax=Actinoplanes sp. NPDC051470 TaxID=3157224 RepID=UPI00344A2031
METWLHPQLGTTTRDDARAPKAYMAALQHVARTLDADPAWRSWWRDAGLTTCELGIVAEDKLDHLRPSADIRQHGTHVRANFTSTPAPASTDRKADLVTLAATELTGMFEVIREAIGLPGLPPLPVLPDLPAGTPAVEVTTKSLPSAPRELEHQQGYLTLAQIHEFFG